MKPYYEDDYATIYHADCREILPQLESVDLVLTDPPYSEKTHVGARSEPISPYQGESQKKISFQSWSADALRGVFESVDCRGWLISFMDWRHIYEIEQAPPSGYRFIRFGVWVKPNCAPQFTGDRPATGWEGVAILHSDKGRPSWNAGGNRAVWTANIDNSGIHPTAKPQKMIAKLLRDFAPPSAVVLDPFMGSGTMLRAAKDLGIKSIGIEIEEKYCEIAVKRLRQEILFGEAA
jgi:site-specific DNA-methyltransferase (adenine-specific)